MPKLGRLECLREVLWAWQAVSSAMLSERLFAKAFNLEAVVPRSLRVYLRPMGLVDSGKGSCPGHAKRRQATGNSDCTTKVQARLHELSTFAPLTG